jgi:hypothetical protein
LPLTGVQVPLEFVRLQAWQALSQAVLQQTPSAQIPDKHSVVVVHVPPRLFRGAHIMLASQ